MNALLSGSVLAAALALGQTSEPPIVPQNGGAPSASPSSVPPPPTLPTTPAAAQPPQRGPIISFFTREDRPVWTKITSWFKREPAESPAPTPATTPMKGLLQREPLAPPPAAPTPPPSNDFPRRLPNSSSKTTTPAISVAQHSDETARETEIVPKSAPPPTATKAANSPIRAQFVNKIGRDEKFEWITGQLERENGAYVIYYATPETLDKYNGRLVLQLQQVDMKDLQRGDLVSVHGQLALRAGGPVYRLTSAGLIERPRS